jgi:Core-2/I-Branching enzyme
MKKLAFCFLIYDKINHEDIWNTFFENIDSNKYSIYIHFKFNSTLKYFEKYKLTKCIATRYEDYTIPLAYNLLFRNAYDDMENYKFIILSGSCIPLKSFDYVYEKLTRDSYGYFNVSPQEQCFPVCNSLIGKIPNEKISKSHNWFILNRQLVDKLCFDKDNILKNLYKQVYAPAEYFYYTFIKLENLENEIIITNNISKDATTFTNWEGTDYKYPSLRSLKNYTFISSDELNYLLESNSLFGRKFLVECKHSLNTLKYIETITSVKVNEL